MKYIEAEKLRAEINRLYNNEAEKDESILAADAYKNALDAVEKFLDSLHQEQPKTDLETFDNEVTKMWGRCAAHPYDTIACLHIDSFIEIARNFYELGLKARKEE